MWTCALATAAPLLLGWFLGGEALHLAVNGALLGYFVALVEPAGNWKRRWLVSSVSFVLMLGIFILGMRLQGHPGTFTLVAMMLTYALGWVSGTAPEIERVLLFFFVDVLVAYYSPLMSGVHLEQTLPYCLLAYVTFSLTLLLHRKTVAAPNLTPPSLRHAPAHLYAVCSVIAVLASIKWVEYQAIERPYWTVITVLLVMRPDRRASVYRSLQRLLGTLIGVALGEVVIELLPHEEILILGVILAAFWIPNAMRRSYLQVSWLVSIVVMFLIAIPTVGRPDVHVPMVRLMATLYGCVIGLLGVAIYSAFNTSNKDGTRRPEPGR